jgi:hypothetical protein
MWLEARLCGDDYHLFHSELNLRLGRPTESFDLLERAKHLFQQQAAKRTSLLGTLWLDVVGLD